MEIKYNVTGEERKLLVNVLAEITGQQPRYMGAPTFNYVVGEYTVDKNGTVSFESKLDDNLFEALQNHGFASDEQNCDDSLVMELPRAGITDEQVENLRKLIASKERLIKQAIGADALPVEVTEDKLRFPWLRGQLGENKVAAYAHLIGAMVGLAKNQQRINAVQKPIEDDKYAFRCFLLRLGFIGPDYKEARRILLENLSGNSAHKSRRWR